LWLFAVSPGAVGLDGPSALGLERPGGEENNGCLLTDLDLEGDCEQLLPRASSSFRCLVPLLEDANSGCSITLLAGAAFGLPTTSLMEVAMMLDSVSAIA